MRTATLVLSSLMALSLAACGEEEEMPETGAEARERLVDARVVRQRTGAEIQDRIATSIIRAEYACLNGERLSVVFDNQRELATVRMLDGTAVDLRQERAADGFWYRSDQHELRGVGRDATWLAPLRDETTCQALS